jgi:hypothetical protein
LAWAALLLGSIPASAADRAVVGVSQQGGNASEYIGVIQQNGPEFTAVGYLTHVHGVDPAALYTDPAVRTAATARFTFTSNATAVSNSTVGAVTQIGAVGKLNIYFNATGGADFANPDSFAVGTEIAALDARFHNILSVIAPNSGVADATVETTQRIARAFDLDGQKLKFGHPELRQRMTLAGKATRSQVAPPLSTTEFAAAAVTK